MSCEEQETNTLCLKKSIFKELLDKYPKAKEHWMAKSKERRIEIRRVSKQAYFYS